MSINQSFSAQVRFRLMASVMIAAALPCAWGADESTKSPPLAPHQVITVGPADADVVGTTGRAVQIAIDALAHRGGGEVRVKPGEYLLAAPIRLRPGIRLIGEPGKTILRRGPLVWSALKVDADKAEREITPENTNGFRPGMAVTTWDRRNGWLRCSRPYTVTDIRDGVLCLDDYLEADRIAEDGGRVIHYFPLILVEESDHVVVDGFVADAAVKDPDTVLDGLRAGVVYLWRSRHVTVRNVKAVNGRGDGIIVSNASEHAVIEDCEAAHNTHFGIHPGSHSKYATVRRCDIHHNGYDGLYICWGIRNSEFTDNTIHHNGLTALRSGICIGHKDTDNLIARNHIYENKKAGIYFRRKTVANGAHRNRIVENVIENNGARPGEFEWLAGKIEPSEFIGVGIGVFGHTYDLLIEDNTIRETREGDDRLQKHAVYLHPGAKRVKMVGNTTKGHPGRPVLDESGANDHQLQTLRLE
jgi:hypothetical protein